MNGYGIALFLHLCALLAAFAASAVIGLAMHRIRSARVAGEALQWLGTCKAVAHVFPVALLTLLGTGAYMVHRAWSWEAGWVWAGIAGIVFLGVAGDRVEGGRAKRIARELAADPGAPLEGRLAALVRDPLWWTAAMVNHAVALAVVFAMAAKPGLAGSVAALLVAVAVGAAVAVPLRRPPAPAEARATA